jgi:hypothetical protein
MSMDFLRSAVWWSNILAVTFGALAAVAALAALIFGGKLSAAEAVEEERYKSGAAAEIAKANVIAAQANQGAAAAGERSGLAAVDAARANERAGRLEVEAATQRERAATAELELLRLKERFRQRTVSAEQSQVLIATLLGAEIKSKVEVVAPIGDSEAHEYAQQLCGLLIAGGWPCEGLNISMFNGPTPVGLFVRAESESTITTSARSLTEALQKAGQRIAYERASVSPDRVTLVVGRKPV